MERGDATGQASLARGGWLWLPDRYLEGKPKTYCAYARDYFDREVPLAAVEAIYRHEELSDELVAKLNPELELSDLMPDAAEIGYPD
jgi:hypothetical protein